MMRSGDGFALVEWMEKEWWRVRGRCLWWCRDVTERSPSSGVAESAGRL